MCKSKSDRDRRKIKIKIAFCDHHHSSDLSQTTTRIYFAYLLLRLDSVVWRHEVKTKTMQVVQIEIFVDRHQVHVQIRAWLSDAWLAETRSVTITDQNTSPITGNPLVINYYKLKNLSLSFIFLFFSSFFLQVWEKCVSFYLLLFFRRWLIIAGIAGTTRQKGEYIWMTITRVPPEPK